LDLQTQKNIHNSRWRYYISVRKIIKKRKKNSRI